MSRFATIVATGRYIPEIEVSNDVLRERFAHLPEFVDKMEASTGIRTRWYAPDEWATSDLAAAGGPAGAGARRARSPRTSTSSSSAPTRPTTSRPRPRSWCSTSSGATNAGTFDVGCACASFPTGLAAARGLIATNPCMKTVARDRRVHDAQARRPERPDGLLLRRRRRRRGARAAGRAGLRRLGVPRRRRVPRALGHLRRRHRRAGDASRRCGRAAPRCAWSSAIPPEVNDEGWPRLVRELAANGSSTCRTSTSRSSPRCASRPSRW